MASIRCCSEIYAAIRHKEEETYMTGLSTSRWCCNGLQHYAALGRDYDGVAAVNLIPSDKPQDVYRVLDIVLRTVKEDQDNEEDPETQYLAQKVVILIVKL